MVSLVRMTCYTCSMYSVHGMYNVIFYYMLFHTASDDMCHQYTRPIRVYSAVVSCVCYSVLCCIVPMLLYGIYTLSDLFPPAISSAGPFLRRP